MNAMPTLSHPLALVADLASMLAPLGREALGGYLLLAAVLIPFACGIVLLVGGGFSKGARQALAALGFVPPALIAVVLFGAFHAAGAGSGYLFLIDLPVGLEAAGIRLFMGLNAFSMPLFLLAGLVGLAAGLCAIRHDYQRPNVYLALVLFILGGVLGTFASIDIFYFYFFHEVALIPTFILIATWGGRERRNTVMEMLMYLSLGALLSLGGLILVYQLAGLQSFDLITLKAHLAVEPIPEFMGRVAFGLILFGFGVLVGLFPLYNWAPITYTAAPAPAAMLHAGVLKKFGLYGLLQIAMPLLPAAGAFWSPVLIWLALANVLIVGFIAIGQMRFKMLAGYSSIMHMGYAFLGIAVMTTTGYTGVLLLLVAHGLSVALLFYLADILENRAFIVDMRNWGGLVKSAPLMTAFVAVGVFATIGLPGFANFWGELVIFLAVWEWAPWAGALAVLGIVISAIYGLRALANIFFGEKQEYLLEAEKENGKPIADLSPVERAPALLLIIPLLALGFWPSAVTAPAQEVFEADAIEQSVTLTEDEEASLEATSQREEEPAS